MLSNCVLNLIACAGTCLLAASAGAQPLGVDLVINGDAESGTIAGWVDGGIEAKPSAGAGTTGLPAGVSIGEFSFTGGLGALAQTLSQQIDVSGRAVAIDAGEITSTFAVLLQSRAGVGHRDTAAARLEFRSSAGDVIGSVAFEDASGEADWEPFADERIVPAGTRSVWIELHTARPSGTGESSDGFFDNVSLILSSGCYADCDGSGTLDFFDFLCFQNAFAAGEPYADCDGSGARDFFDFLCFQNAFAAGCP